MNELQMIRQKTSSLHALIVDDEEDIRESTVLFMKKFCTNVDGASNGEMALKMVKEQGPYDIVLTDIRMPKMSGWALADKLKNMDDDLFVTMMTASPGMDDVAHQKYDLYLSKPIDIDKMKIMLRTLIEKKGL